MALHSCASRWLPAAGSQELSQLFAGAVHERSGGDLRDPKHLRDLLERQPFLVAKHDRHSILVTQGTQRLIDGTAKCFGLYGIRWH